MTESPFAAAARELMALGYTPIPIIPPGAAHGGAGKAPGEYRSGAWRGMSRWERFRDRAPTEFEHGLWARNFPDANLGVVMGTQIGEHRLVAVDLDVTDPDELDELISALPYSPMVKRGAKGQTLFYKAPATVKTRVYDVAGKRAVDLLTGYDTRQTVCPPSRHTAGMDYAWLRGPVAATDLPLFDDDALERFEDTLRHMGWDPDARRSTTVATGVDAVLPDDDDFFSETKTAALANLGAWVTDLDLHGLRKARGGYEAVATWRPSTTGQPIEKRKRNLSIQPSGITDFGANQGYSAIDLVMAARTCDQAEATSWLRSRLGLSGDEEIVIALQMKPAPEVVTERAEPKALKAKAPARDQAGELPEHLTHVPGLVGELTDWMSDSARRPQRGMSLLASLCLVGTASGRKYSGPTRTGTHLYGLALARSSAGKDHALHAIPRVLTACGMAAHIGPSQFMSMSAVIKRLTRQPLTMSAIDEFGAFLGRINGRKASTHERAITGILRTAWGCSFQTMLPPEWANSSSEPIHSPALSLYGASVHQEFFDAIEGGDVYNGFLNRFLLISTHMRPAEREPTADAFEVPEAIVARMRDIYGAGGALVMASSHNDRADAPTMVVPWADAQAKRAYQRMGEQVESREGDMAFLARSVEMAQRLATIRAIGICNARPVVTCEDMEWGRDLALWSAERMMADAADFMSENDHQDNANKVLRLVRASGTIKRRDLIRRLQNVMRSRDLDEILKMLTESEQISATKMTPTGGGTPTITYGIAT